jgi:PAS domain S-box-containing protein
MAQRAERGRLTAEGVSTELGAETERRRQAEESFKGLVEAAPNALVLVDHAGTITLVNSQTERWFGYARDDLLGRKVELLVPAELHDRHRAHLAGYTKNPTRRPMGSGIRLEAVRKDGSRFAVDISLSPVRTVEGPRIIAAINDISHHREAQDELERTNRTLSAVNHELEAFAYSVSHDLRQPLRAVDGFCNALQEDYQAQLDDTGKRYLEQVRAGAQRMGRLIDDLLQLSRITRAELKREPVDMTAVAQAILEELRQGEPERDVSVKIADGLQAVADPRMLEVLLSNLLGNAWKFTAHSETPEIELGVQNGQTVPVYFVRDNGVGFDMKYVKNLFGAFQRLHSDAEFPGTGIGLATVQRIVHRLGGQVWVTAVRGEGATFFFTLST